VAKIYQIKKKRTCNSVPSRRKKNFVIFFNNKKIFDVKGNIAEIDWKK
jgi:hypothetical protein